MSNSISNLNQIERKNGSNLIIFFYLTRVKREEIGFLIQFLQKSGLNFSRIKNKKQVHASNFILKNSNFMAQSSKPIEFNEFLKINQFLNTQAIVVGFKYGNIIWDVPRTKIELSANSADLTWSLLNRVTF